MGHTPVETGCHYSRKPRSGIESAWAFILGYFTPLEGSRTARKET
jgi:hypothetical protein